MADDKRLDLRGFTAYSMFDKPIEDSGRMDDINMSSTWTKLIQIAGLMCERYASDLLIDINAITEKMKSRELKDGDSFLFGFRECGVDHWSFVECQDEELVNYYYRQIWRMDVEIEEHPVDHTRDWVKFKLYRVSYNRYTVENFRRQDAQREREMKADEQSSADESR